jgi:hypothetical protein
LLRFARNDDRFIGFVAVAAQTPMARIKRSLFASFSAEKEVLPFKEF